MTTVAADFFAGSPVADSVTRVSRRGEGPKIRLRHISEIADLAGEVRCCGSIGILMKMTGTVLAVGGRTTMRWYHYLAYFFGGAFLANTLPHLVNGVSGNAFQSPFASPPGVGLSSATVNVLWGVFNLVVAYLLVCRVGSFDLRKTQHVLLFGAGILIMSLLLARSFGPLHGGM
jgi:hypothetical protein